VVLNPYKWRKTKNVAQFRTLNTTSAGAKKFTSLPRGNMENVRPKKKIINNLMGT